MRHASLAASLLLATALATAASCQQTGDPTPAQSRLGINLAGPADWSSELPFVDVFRLSREWISQREGAGWGQGPTLERDEHGWIRRLEPGCFAETPMCTIDGGHYPEGEYTCLWEGKGRIEFGNIGRVVSEEPGRIVFEPAPSQGPIWLRLRETDPADPVRDIRVLMPGFEATYAEEPFHPAFLARWASMNTLRFMDWMLTNGSPVVEWADRPTPDYCNTTERGVPLETMVALANRLGANPWFCMPHKASDDYVRRFAEAVKTSLDPELRVYVEYSNELWNSGFSQTHYCDDQGLALKLAEQPWEAGWRYSARRSVEIFRIWEEVFGGAERLVRVIASQAANAYVTERKLEFGDAGHSCDALAIAPYMTCNIPPTSEDPDQLTAPVVASWSVDRLLDHVEAFSLPESVRWIGEQKAVAERYGLELIAYEAGQHLVGILGGENNDDLTRLFQAANRHPRMGELYTRYLDAWREAGGELCCLFSSVGGWSKWGSWGLSEYYDESEAAQPKLAAVLAWNRANARR